MRIHCQCGAAVEAANVNVAAAIASCTACGAVFSLAAPKREVDVAEVIPASFVTEHGPDRLEGRAYRTGALEPGVHRWTYRWFRWWYLPILLVLLIWDGFCGFFVGGVIAESGAAGIATIAIPHVWIGILGSYWVVAHLFDRSKVELDASRIRVVHGPVPWRGTEFARAEVASVDAHAGWRQNGQATWQVRVVSPARRASKLIGGLDEEEAKYLASELRQALAVT